MNYNFIVADDVLLVWTKSIVNDTIFFIFLTHADYDYPLVAEIDGFCHRTLSGIAKWQKNGIRI